MNYIIGGIIAFLGVVLLGIGLYVQSDVGSLSDDLFGLTTFARTIAQGVMILGGILVLLGATVMFLLKG